MSIPDINLGQSLPHQPPRNSVNSAKQNKRDTKVLYKQGKVDNNQSKTCISVIKSEYQKQSDFKELHSCTNDEVTTYITKKD